jgi:putative phosphoribosyl transferase
MIINMYFEDRSSAGKQLSKLLSGYHSQDCSILSVSPGGMLVGEQMAVDIHSNLILMLTEDIKLPGEPGAYATISGDNSFTYNSMYSVGEIEEFNQDYFTFIEQERMTKLHNLHLLLGSHGEINKNTLKDHVIILTSDGLRTGYSFDIAMNFLKTIAIKKIIVAVPFATPEAYDRIRLIADEVVCLNIVDNYINVNHYYTNNEIPNVSKLLDLSDNIALHWKLPKK